MEKNERMSITETAAYLGKNISTIHRYKREKLLPFYKVAGTVYFIKSEIDQAMKQEVGGNGH